MQIFRRIFKYLYASWQWINGSSISWYADIKSKPCFPHGMKGIFISGAAKVGKDCVIFQQVTIGSNTLIDSKNAGAPSIGDRCYIGVGAKVIGNVKIGNNVRIGANAVVHTNIPDDHVVVIGELKIFHKQNMDNRFYNYPGSWKCYENGKFSDVNDERLYTLQKLNL